MPRRPETQMPRAKFPDEYKYPDIIWNFNKLAQMPRRPGTQKTRPRFPDEYKYPDIIWNLNKLAQMPIPMSQNKQTQTWYCLTFFSDSRRCQAVQMPRCPDA